MSKYNKAIAASIVAVIEILTVVLPQTQGTLRSVLGVLIPLLGIVVVYFAPANTPPATKALGAQR
jgi:hypothetical protein